MNRVIKFRAWDTITKTMDYEGGQLEPTWILHNRIYEPYSDAHILMQFTGLLDKNGKEIYEGDIVIISLDRPQGNFQVLWGDADGHWCCENKFYSNYPLGLCLPTYREVIGNIYSNPELLTTQNNEPSN